MEIMNAAIRRIEPKKYGKLLSNALPKIIKTEQENDRAILIVEKLLLMPTEQLKSLTDAETVSTYTEALTRLFALYEDERRKVEPFSRDRKGGGRQPR